MKNVKIISVIITIIILIAVMGITYINKNKDKGIDTIKQVETGSEITLDSEQYINSLKKVNIKGTNDYIVITENVKWEVPESEKGTTVSFTMVIPYTINVDGIDYDGTYMLGSSDNYSKGDNNPKYNLKVTNLTRNGEIRILISEK